MGHALAQRGGDDELGGRDAGSNGSQPRAEGVPDELREDGGEILQQALGYESGLDEEMIGVELALDVIAIVKGFAMHVLIAVSPPQRFHLLHPEVIRQSADLVHRLSMTGSSMVRLDWIAG